jgi:hypothetical protein
MEIDLPLGYLRNTQETRNVSTIKISGPSNFEPDNSRSKNDSGSIEHGSADPPLTEKISEISKRRRGKAISDYQVDNEEWVDKYDDFEEKSENMLDTVVGTDEDTVETAVYPWEAAMISGPIMLSVNTNQACVGISNVSCPCKLAELQKNKSTIVLSSCAAFNVHSVGFLLLAGPSPACQLVDCELWRKGFPASQRFACLWPIDPGTHICARPACVSTESSLSAPWACCLRLCTPDDARSDTVPFS